MAHGVGGGKGGVGRVGWGGAPGVAQWGGDRWRKGLRAGEGEGGGPLRAMWPGDSCAEWRWLVPPHAPRLAANARFLDGLRAAAARGAALYGECTVKDGRARSVEIRKVDGESINGGSVPAGLLELLRRAGFADGYRGLTYRA